MLLAWLKNLIFGDEERYYRSRISRAAGGGTDGASKYERAHSVRFTEVGVVVSGPGFDPEAVNWDDLRRLSILTTDRGPWRPDLWWILGRADGTFALFPNGAIGERKFERIIRERLKGFDEEAYTRAMRCIEDSKFVLWERA